MEHSADVLRAMGNPKRLEILTLLLERELAVNELASMLDLNQPAISRHLSKLRMAGLVSTRRVAQTIYYSCKSEGVIAVLGALIAAEVLERETAQGVRSKLVD